MEDANVSFTQFLKRPPARVDPALRNVVDVIDLVRAETVRVAALLEDTGLHLRRPRGHLSGPPQAGLTGGIERWIPRPGSPRPPGRRRRPGRERLRGGGRLGQPRLLRRLRCSFHDHLMAFDPTSGQCWVVSSIPPIPSGSRLRRRRLLLVADSAHSRPHPGPGRRHGGDGGKPPARVPPLSFAS